VVVTHLEARVARVEAALRTLQEENEARAARVLDWMKRAERAERRVKGGDETEGAVLGRPTDGDGPPRSVLQNMLKSRNPRIRAAAERRLNGLPNANAAPGHKG